LVTDQEESQNPFVILDCTFPAPTRPKSPKSSPFFTERLIPSRLTSTPSLDHEKSASLIDKTWRRLLEVTNFLLEKKNYQPHPRVATLELQSPFYTFGVLRY
jgi:hypothetical protein